MAILSYVVTALAAYLLGSFPTGYLVAKARGIDIREVGSGNIGATNVLRALGKPAGIAVLVADAFKGWAAVVGITRMVFALFSLSPDASTRELYAICAALSVILGHNYTCWLGFKGGKGIATSAGVLAALVPWALLVLLCTWIIFFAITRIVSVGSIVASFTLPFASWFTTKSWTLTGVTAAMGALAIYKHAANIRRLIAGTEPRLGSKPPAPGDATEAAK